MRRLVLAFLGLVVNLCLMQACDPTGVGEVGVSTTGDAIVFRVIPCESNSLIESVALVGTIGEANEGSVFWEESSDSGSTVRDYQVGQPTGGFVEDVPLTNVDPDAKYVARVLLANRPKNQSITTVFVPSELVENSWKVSFGSPLTTDELNRLDGCG